VWRGRSRPRADHRGISLLPERIAKAFCTNIPCNQLEHKALRVSRVHRPCHPAHITPSCDGNHGLQQWPRFTLAAVRSYARPSVPAPKGEAMALTDSASGKVIREYSIKRTQRCSKPDARLRPGRVARGRIRTRRRHAFHHRHCGRALFTGRQSRSEESQLGQARPHHLVHRPQGAQLVSPPRLRRILPARRRSHAAQARFALSGPSALAEAPGRRGFHRIPGAD
jgi:hypothetical protein